MNWRLLQLADSAFPTGGFAHSGGLEAASQAGDVSLSRFAREAIWQAAHGALPLVKAAFDGELALADARAESFLVNHVANRASRTQGRAFLSTCSRVFSIQLPTAGVKLHLAPLWGAASKELQLELADSQRIYLWTTVRGILSAAVRIGLAGTLEAQTLLAGLDQPLDEALKACGGLTLDDRAQTAPLLDLLQGTHDRLYSRLFQS
ncbi:MAG TPA: urease accessory UreF family protein [Myxococcales bacterium]|nr:urease accessory UreF family protein [Myxococcales bacterium]